MINFKIFCMTYVKIVFRITVERGKCESLELALTWDTPTIKFRDGQGSFFFRHTSDFF